MPALNVVFAYILELKCDECEMQDRWRGRKKRVVEKFARSKGWWFKGNHAKCPKHKQIQSDYRRREHVHTH